MEGANKVSLVAAAFLCKLRAAVFTAIDECGKVSLAVTRSKDRYAEVIASEKTVFFGQIATQSDYLRVIME